MHKKSGLRSVWTGITFLGTGKYKEVLNTTQPVAICPKKNYNRTFRINNFQSGEWIKI